MTRPNIRPPSSQLKVPVLDDSYEGLKVENALLMRRNLFLIHADLKLRAALELATGVPWDSENIIDKHGDELEAHIAKNFAHGMGISEDAAKERIAKHRRLANASQVETPEGSLSAIPVTNRVIPTIGGKPAPNLH